MILIRHGQSHFNVHYGATRQDPGIVDPGLTEEGVRQVEAAAERLLEEARRQPLARLVVSPYTRALETAEILNARLKLPVTIEPMVRERAHFTCDVGTLCSELRARWAQHDFGDLPESWWDHPEEPEEALLLRCDDFRCVAAGWPDWRETLVVSHWAFIRGLTGQGLGNAEYLRFDPTEAMAETGRESA